MAEKVPFVLPALQDNPDGWGPSPAVVPDKFRDLPYAPFSKSDRLGRSADWTGQQQYQGRGGGRYGQQPVVSTVFNYYHVDDDDSFTTVDNRSIPKPRGYYHQRGRFGQMRGGQRGFYYHQRGRGGQQQRGGRRNFGGGRGDGRRQTSGWGMLRSNETMRPRLPASVDVRPEWGLVEDFDFPSLARVAVLDEPEPEDLASFGEVEFYDPEFDRITTKTERPLEKTDRSFVKVSTSDDPVLKEMADEGQGTVFATSAILALLMTSPRSVYSWDLSITKTGDLIVLDKANYATVDTASVNETYHDTQHESAVDPINSAESLTKEATQINQAFSQQVLSKTESPLVLGPPPFKLPEEARPASAGYTYRRWTLSDDIVVVARCELDGALKSDKGEPDFLTIKALNEWDPRASGSVAWRQKLDTQRGAVLASELKNNSFKLARWTMQALLSGVGGIRLGYVSRHHPKDNATHVILGTQLYKPREFATQINLNVNNCWAILRHFVNAISKYPDGQYVMLKDPSRPVVHVYEIPREGETARSHINQQANGRDEDSDEEQQQQQHASRAGEKAV